MTAHAGSNRARRSAIRLLGWYPRPWRMRYEREMRALLEDIPVTWKQVGNIAGTAIREWLSPRAFGWPARSAAGRLFWIRMLTFLAWGYAADGVSRILASRLPADTSIEDPMGFAAVMLTLAFTFRVLGEGAVRMSKRPWALRARGRGWSLSLRDWEAALWCVALIPYLAVRHAEGPADYATPTMNAIRPYMVILQVYVWAWMAFMASARTQRLMRIQSSHIKRSWRQF
jgi:hypothetical protein